MTNCKEEYIISWILPGRMVWIIGHVFNTYDEALKVINRYKHTDKKIGKEYKYRIIKQTIQEEVVYDEL